MISERRLKTMHRLAWTAVLLMVAVTSASCWLRLAQPRAECETWPFCRSLATHDTAGTTPDQATSPRDLRHVRALHRAVASLALLTVIALVVVALARPPRDWTAGTPALALLALALGLSALGIVTTGSRATSVLLGNLLGGYAMLAIAWRMTRRGLVIGDDAAQKLGRRARVGVALWTTQVALGAVSGAGQATAAAWGHLGLAIVTAAWAFGVGTFARRAGLRAEGAALRLVVIGQWLLGSGAALSAAPPNLVLVHNLAAALGLALLVGLCGRGASESLKQGPPEGLAPN